MYKYIEEGTFGDVLEKSKVIPIYHIKEKGIKKLEKTWCEVLGLIYCCCDRSTSEARKQ